MCISILYYIQYMFVFTCCCVKKCTINLIKLIFLLNHIYLLTKRSFEEKSNKYNYAVVKKKYENASKHTGLFLKIHLNIFLWTLGLKRNKYVDKRQFSKVEIKQNNVSTVISFIKYFVNQSQSIADEICAICKEVTLSI